MRIAPAHGAAGVEIFVFGVSGGGFPARQHQEASRAIARKHGLDPARTLFLEQNPRAIAAGAFHNDVVAVANERVLFTHESAFADRDAAYAAIRAAAPWVEIVEVSESEVPLGDAITSYLFNAQLVTLPEGDAALVVPTEATTTPSVARYMEKLVSGNGPIRKVMPVDVRQSMANGGGPACLRLRVVADPATVDARFLCSAERIDQAAEIVARHWPESLSPEAMASEALLRDVQQARLALLQAFDLTQLA